MERIVVRPLLMIQSQSHLGAVVACPLGKGFSRTRACDHGDGDYICHCDAKDASEEITVIEGVVDVAEHARTRTEL